MVVGPIVKTRGVASSDDRMSSLKRRPASRSSPTLRTETRVGDPHGTGVHGTPTVTSSLSQRKGRQETVSVGHTEKEVQSKVEIVDRRGMVLLSVFLVETSLISLHPPTTRPWVTPFMGGASPGSCNPFPVVFPHVDSLFTSHVDSLFTSTFSPINTKRYGGSWVKAHCLCNQ